MLGARSLFIPIGSKMLIIISFRGLHYLMIIMAVSCAANGLYALKVRKSQQCSCAFSGSSLTMPSQFPEPPSAEEKVGAVRERALF